MNHIEKRIIELGLYKNEFADKIGITRMSLYKITSGKIKSMNLSTAVKISEGLGVTLEFILNGDKDVNSDILTRYELVLGHIKDNNLDRNNCSYIFEFNGFLYLISSSDDGIFSLPKKINVVKP